MRYRITISLSILLLVCQFSAFATLGISINGADYLRVPDTAPHVGVINGVVLNSDGKPVSGVTVSLKEEPRLFSDTGPTSGNERRRVYHVPEGREMVLLETLCNADGTFSFQSLPLSPFVVATHTDTGRYKGRVELGQDQPQKELKITIEPAVVLQGKIVDTKGNPAAGAEIHVSGANDSVDSSDTSWSQFATVPADGSFRFPGAPIGAYFITVKYGDHGTHFESGVRYEGKPLKIVVQHSSQVSGLAVDEETGRPISGIRFTLFNLEVQVNSSRNAEPTDELGKFSFTGVRPGLCRFATSYDRNQDRPWVFFGEAPEIRVSEDSNSTLTIKMRRSATVTGRIIDGDTQTPIANAHVYLSLYSESPTGSTSQPRAHTDENGRYTLPGLPPGKFKVQYEYAEGYPHGSESTTASFAVKSTGNVEAKDIAVRRGLSLSGKTVDLKDMPVANVRVECEVDGKSPRDLTAESGDDGTFQVFGLRKGMIVYVYALRNFGAGTDNELVSDMAGPFEIKDDPISNVTLDVYSTGSIAGVLLDKARKPVPNVRVVATHAEEHPVPNSTSHSIPFRRSTSFTDTSGRFWIRHLHAGDHTIALQTNSSPKALDRAAIRVERSQHLTGIEIVAENPGLYRIE